MEELLEVVQTFSQISMKHFQKFGFKQKLANPGLYAKIRAVVDLIRINLSSR